MCGRYTLRAKPRSIADEFDLPELPIFRPSFNIAPNEVVPVVRFDPIEGSRRLDLLTWGLIPSWADDPGIGDRMINVCAETVADKPHFATRSEPGDAWWLPMGSTNGTVRMAGSARSSFT